MVDRLPKDSRESWFALMWASATLFHLAGNIGESAGTNLTLMCLTLILALGASRVLVFRQSRGSLFLICLVLPMQAWLEAPNVGNHWVLAAMVSSIYAGEYLFQLKKGYMFNFDRFASYAKLTTMVFYVFAVFSKMNTDFIDPSVSCANAHFYSLMQSLNITIPAPLSTFVKNYISVGTILIEMLIPILLLHRKTAGVGILVAVAFHYILALNLNQHFWDFSSVLFSLFFLFFSRSQVDRLREITSIYRGPRINPTFIVILCTIVGILNVTPSQYISYKYLFSIGHISWWIYGTIFLMLIIQVSLQQGVHTRVKRIQWSPLAIVPILSLLNGLSPYLGLKDAYSWNMYSNLGIKRGDSNHLIIRRAYDILGLRKSIAEIVSSDNNTLNSMKERRYGIILKELTQYYHQNPNIALEFKIVGEGSTIKSTKDLRSHNIDNPLYNKIIVYLPVDLSQSERCR